MAPASPASLAHAVDQISGMKFLADTGAAYSVIPNSSPAPARGLPLRGAGGSFLRATVQLPLLGADFLRANKLLVDLDGESVLVKNSGVKIPTSAVSGAAIFPSVSHPASPVSPVPACTAETSVSTSPSLPPSTPSTPPDSVHVPRSRCPIAIVGHNGS